MGSTVSAATQTQSGFQCLRVVGRLYLLLSEEPGSPRSEARRTVAVMASWARSGQRARCVEACLLDKGTTVGMRRQDYFGQGSRGCLMLHERAGGGTTSRPTTGRPRPSTSTSKRAGSRSRGRRSSRAWTRWGAGDTHPPKPRTGSRPPSSSPTGREGRRRPGRGDPVGARRAGGPWSARGLTTGTLSALDARCCSTRRRRRAPARGRDVEPRRGRARAGPLPTSWACAAVVARRGGRAVRPRSRPRVPQGRSASPVHQRRPTGRGPRRPRGGRGLQPIPGARRRVALPSPRLARRCGSPSSTTKGRTPFERLDGGGSRSVLPPGLPSPQAGSLEFRPGTLPRRQRGRQSGELVAW